MSDVTRLLSQIESGDPSAAEQLLPLVYDELRRLAKESRDAKQTRRLLSLATIYDGGSRADAARTGGVGVQIVRDWVLRFNAQGAAGLIDRKAPGQPSRLKRATTSR